MESPPTRHHQTKHSQKKQARILQEIDNQANAAPDSSENYPDTDDDDEMARTRASKRRAQEAIAGASQGQRPRRGGQGRARGGQNEADEVPAPQDQVQAQMAQLLGILNQNPDMAARLVDAGANNRGQIAPPGPREDPEEDDEGAEEAAVRDQILMDSLSAAQKNHAKKEMLLLIKDGVKHGLWRRIKIIESPEVRRQAALFLLAILNFLSMEGDSIEAKKLQDGWLRVYETFVCKLLNEHRSYVQQRLKLVVYAWYKKHDNTMPPMDLLLALIRRDFALQAGPPAALSEEDYDVLSWWITQVLPIAAGNQCDWGAEHYQYMTVQEGHYPDNANKLYVSDSTEAIAVWIIENNYTCWPAQWAAKAQFGDYPVSRKAKETNGTEVTLANSRVSTVFWFDLHLFFIVLPFLMHLLDLLMCV